MTITLNRSESLPQSLTGGDAAGLLGTLHRTVAAVSQLDPDVLHSGTAAGAAVVTLAGAARQAAFLLGAEPGTALRRAPGVVVMRELASATSLLERTASRYGGPADLDALQRTAERADAAYAGLLDSLTAAA